MEEGKEERNDGRGVRDRCLSLCEVEDIHCTCLRASLTVPLPLHPTSMIGALFHIAGEM